MKLLKIITVLLFFISLPEISHAQDDFEHLLKNRKIRFSIFGGPLFELSSVHNNLGFSTGLGGGILLNQTLYFGGYGMRLAPVIGTDVELNSINYDNLEIAFRHRGIWLGYIHNYNKLLHFGASTKIGWGNINLNDPNLPNPYEDHVMVLTPQVEAEVNIMKWFKVNVGLGYRIVTGLNETVLNTKDFNSPQLTIGLYLGWFRQKS